MIHRARRAGNALRMATRLSTAGLLLWAGMAVARAQTPVTPPDPAALSPQVRAAVNDLAGIVARHDVAAFKRHLQPDTTISFGGDYGPVGLDMVWEPQRADTQLWRELEQILRLGGVQLAGDDGMPRWCAPWPACVEVNIAPDMTAYDHVVVTGTGVAVRAAPDTTSALLGRVGHASLPLAPGDQGAWWAVRWHGGTGYVRSDLARSPVDLRITLQAGADDWRILYFVAGD